MSDMSPGSHPSWVHDAKSEFAAIVDDDLTIRRAHAVDASPHAVKRSRVGAETLAAAVARPSSTTETSRLISWAANRGVQVVPWGGGSSVTGAPLPRTESLIIDLSNLDKILEVDVQGGRVIVEAGVMGGTLERELASHSLTTGMSPQSLERSTVGGWVATRATGQFSSRWGGIEHAITQLTVVLADGCVVQLGSPPRGAVGPDLMQLFVGSEGALGLITEVGLRTHPLTPFEELGAYALADVDTGIEAIRQTMALGVRPVVLRLYDRSEARYLGLPDPTFGSVLLVAFTGVPHVAAAEAAVTGALLDALGAMPLGSAPTEAWLARRYDFSYVERRLAQSGGFAETIEVAAGWGAMPELYRELIAALTPLADEVLGHFSHAYTDGVSLYLILFGEAANDRSAIGRLDTIWQQAMEIVLTHGAVISHHHGIGSTRAPWLPEQLGPAGFSLLKRLKHALDPNEVLHPGSLVPASTSTSAS